MTLTLCTVPFDGLNVSCTCFGAQQQFWLCDLLDAACDILIIVFLRFFMLAMVYAFFTKIPPQFFILYI